MEDVSSAECPKSVILRAPEAVELVQVIGQAGRVEGALGKPSTWPGAFYDVVTFLKFQEDMDSAAQRKAISNSR